MSQTSSGQGCMVKKLEDRKERGVGVADVWTRKVKEQ
jgi:hypothetical protein